MSNYKEIVAKTIVGKGKKTTTNEYTLTTENKPNTVLGCWVINNKFNGTNNKNEVKVDGSFDVNVWYSYDNDSKTAVTTKNFTYEDDMKLRVKDVDALTDNNEVIIRSLRQPTVQDVKIKDGEVIMKIEKETGVEIVGEGKVKIAIEDDELPWDEVYDEQDVNNIDESYLKDNK